MICNFQDVLNFLWFSDIFVDFIVFISISLLRSNAIFSASISGLILFVKIIVLHFVVGGEKEYPLLCFVFQDYKPIRNQTPLLQLPSLKPWRQIFCIENIKVIRLYYYFWAENHICKVYGVFSMANAFFLQ